MNTAEYYREQAKQARARAKDARDPYVKKGWLKVAEQYDYLARIAEEEAKTEAKRP